MPNNDNNDIEKLEQIYNLHKGRMIKTARDMLSGSGLDADDAVSDAVFKILKYIDKFEEIDTDKSRALIVVIVKNVARDMRPLKRCGEN